MPNPRKNDETLSAPTKDGGMNVVRLEKRYKSETKRGRKPALTFPDLPAEIMEGMTDLEREHFDFFIAAITADNKLRPSDYIGLYAAAMDWIALLRLQAAQLKTGQLVTMSRQHPGPQLRAWLDTMSFSRRKAEPAKQPSEYGGALMALSS